MAHNRSTQVNSASAATLAVNFQVLPSAGVWSSWLVGVLFRVVKALKGGLKLVVITGFVCSAAMVGGVDGSHTAVACKKRFPS